MMEGAFQVALNNTSCGSERHDSWFGLVAFTRATPGSLGSQYSQGEPPTGQFAGDLETRARLMVTKQHSNLGNITTQWDETPSPSVRTIEGGQNDPLEPLRSDHPDRLVRR